MSLRYFQAQNHKSIPFETQPLPPSQQHTCRDYQTAVMATVPNTDVVNL